MCFKDCWESNWLLICLQGGGWMHWMIRMLLDCCRFHTNIHLYVLNLKLIPPPWYTGLLSVYNKCLHSASQYLGHLLSVILVLCLLHGYMVRLHISRWAVILNNKGQWQYKMCCALGCSKNIFFTSRRFHRHPYQYDLCPSSVIAEIIYVSILSDVSNEGWQMADISPINMVVSRNVSKNVATRSRNWID